MKTVQYINSQLLSCANCNGDAFICLSPVLTDGGQPYLPVNIAAVMNTTDNCGKSQYVYSLTYDEYALLDPNYALVASDIEGIFCKGCLTTYIDAQTGSSRKLNVRAVGATTSITLSVVSSGTVYTNENASGAIQFDLPPASASAIGTWYRFVRNASQTIRIHPYGSNIIGFGSVGQMLSLNVDGTSVDVSLLKTGSWQILVNGTVSYV